MSSPWRKSIQAEIAMLRGLLELDHVALRVAPIDALHVADVDWGGMSEGHAQRPQAIVLVLDIGHVDAKVRVAFVERAQRTSRHGFRRAELKHFQIACAGPQHCAARGRAGHVQYLVEYRGVMPTEFFADDLEAEGFGIEFQHP